ncbi:MAG: prepilin-type N-terminal cleavage/methylation domain-containing protein [Candidatus Buchananbacteria bacterium]|jgi:type II secretory pathway pseudopilin PulG
MSKFNNKGISLIEALVSIAIIIIVILAISQIFPLALKISNHAEQETIATNLAQAKIEETFSLNYENIPTGINEAKHRLSTDPNNPFYYYQRQTDVQYVDVDLNDSASDTGLKKITTTVYWQSPIFKTEKNVNLIILISKRN